MCSKITFCLSETKCKILCAFTRGWGCFLCRLCTGARFCIIVLQHGKKSTVHTWKTHGGFSGALLNLWLLLLLFLWFFLKRVFNPWINTHTNMQTNYAMIPWKNTWMYKCTHDFRGLWMTVAIFLLVCNVIFQISMYFGALMKKHTHTHRHNSQCGPGHCAPYQYNTSIETLGVASEKSINVPVHRVVPIFKNKNVKASV